MNWKIASKMVMVSVLLLATGCGTRRTAPDIFVTGKVSAPAGVVLSRTESTARSADATGIAGKAGVTVVIYYVKDDGTPDGENLAAAITDATGNYTLQTRPATTQKLVVSVGTGANRMRNVVTSKSANLTPMTELLTAKLAATGKLNSNFTNEEIIAIRTQVNADSAGINLAAVTDISAAMALLNTGTLAANLNAMVDASEAGTFVAGCGNKVKETGETCDDGNTTAGDGCSATCQTETARNI